VAADTRALDVLSDILALLRLHGEVLCWSELSAPWGLSFAPDDALFFHVIERGTCLLERANSSETFELSGGDLVVLPQGCGHRLVDSRGSRVVPVTRLVDPASGLPGRLRYGGGGAATRILCGRFRFDDPLRLARLPGLPSILHVPGSRGQPPPWLELTMRFLTTEVQSAAPGRDITLSRLVDLLFVQTIRYWLAHEDGHPLGWVRALRDPRIGAALALMHAHPERPWEVEALAAEVGMSRSSFAQRFVELIGEPPTRYLTRVRVQCAARLLQVPGATVAQTAERVGYDSEAAFSRAFKRYMRVAPTAFRAQGAPTAPRASRPQDARAPGPRRPRAPSRAE
jgi:AraC-like DNA-binding protein